MSKYGSPSLVLANNVDADSTSPLGLPVPNVAGLSLATGQATFVEDTPTLSKELFMAPVCSTVAHAKLLSVDPTAALALPGVVRFLDVRDVPEGLHGPSRLIEGCLGGLIVQVKGQALQGELALDGSLTQL